MRRTLIVLSLPAAVAALGLAGGCSSNSAGRSDASADGSGVIVGGGDTGSGDGTADGSSTVPTTMRLAHASSGLGPIDFCWRITGTANFTGPVLAGALTPTDAGAPGDAQTDAETDASAAGDAAGTGDAASVPDTSWDAAEEGVDLDATDGASEPYDAQIADASPVPASLAFGSMTSDVSLPAPGTFDIAIVAAGQTSCLQPLLVDQVTLDAGQRSTVVVMGEPWRDGGPSALTIAGFVDSRASQQSTLVRFIHAALGSSDEPAAPAVAIRANTTLLAAQVDPGKATAESTTPSVDSLGYTTLDAIPGTVSLGLTALGDAGSPTAWTTPSTSLGLQAGSVHTGLVVSLSQGALGVAWCTDVDTAGGGHTACTLLTAAP